MWSHLWGYGDGALGSGDWLFANNVSLGVLGERNTLV